MPISWEFRKIDAAIGDTEIEVDGEALTGGVLARAGQRMIGNAARTLLGQFFKNLNRDLTR